MLSKSNIKLPLIYGILVCCLAYISLQLILACIYLTCSFYMPQIDDNILYTVIGDIISVISFFIMSPLLLGFYALAAGLSNGQRPDFMVIFRYFSSFKLIVRSWLTFCITVLPFALINLALRVTNIILSSYYFSGNAFFAQNLQIIVNILIAPALYVIVFLILGRFYPLINAVVCGGDQPFSVCLKKSLCSTRKKVCEIFLFRMSFLPWILLSTVTFGVLFVIFTLPYMAISYSQYSSYIITSEYRINYLGDITQ